VGIQYRFEPKNWVRKERLENVPKSGTRIPFFGVAVMDKLSSSIVMRNGIKAATAGGADEEAISRRGEEREDRKIGAKAERAEKLAEEEGATDRGREDGKEGQ
jgi:hypothetical protein